jgi:hypothetical protein
VVITYVNPGLCLTDLARHVSEKVREHVHAMRAAHGRTAEMGSRTLLHGVAGGSALHGKYLSECKDKE